MSAEQELANANVQISTLISEVTRWRDASAGLNSIYPTVTEGRQSVGDGKYFSVPGNGAYMHLYRRQGSSAELIAEFPDRDELNSVITQLGPLLGRGVVGGNGDLMAVGAFGLGDTQTSFTAHFDNYTTPGFYTFEALTSNTTNGPTGSAYGSLLVYRRQASDRVMQEFNTIQGNGARYLRIGSSSGWTPWVQVLTTNNTTVDSNGFIKSASPIFRLSNTAEAALVDGLNFVDAGAGAANNEALGVTASHDDVGVYIINGSLGFATEGWTIEVPQDANGNRLCFAVTEQADDGAITVRTFSRKFDFEAVAIVPGDPMDIPGGRWIDLRLSMPELDEPTEEEPSDEMVE